jgi:NADH-quinone oxidoreductase subunit L
LIAVVTSVLTAVYMFRVVYLAFHGEPALSRREAPEGSAARGAAPPSARERGWGPASPRNDDGPHAHGRHLHDAPASMAIALVVLAFGSILAGYVGVPHALGGSNRIETFLEPSFEAHEVRQQEVRQKEVRLKPDLELTLMAVSSVTAFGGIALATWLFLKRRDRADALARAVPGVYRTLLNKYYVDEIYDAVIVRPVERVSAVVLWRGVDAGLIDGTVDGTGASVRRVSGMLRRVQTGSVRAYAASLFLGVVMILGYYLWK